MKIYPVGLSGEAQYQDGILRTHAGEVARIFHEYDNPYDKNALRVENNVGDIIGYIPRASWLHRAVHEDGLGVAATVKSISDGNGAGLLGVVLDVTLTDDEIFKREFKPKRPTRAKQKPVAAKPTLEKSSSIDFANRVLSMVRVPITCGCGAEYSADYRGLEATADVFCPTCDDRASLSDETLARLDCEFHALVNQVLANAELPSLELDEVTSLRLTG